MEQNYTYILLCADNTLYTCLLYTSDHHGIGENSPGTVGGAGVLPYVPGGL